MRKFLVVIALVAVVAAGATVRVLETTERHVLLEYSLGDFQLHEAGEFLHLEMHGAAYETKVGAPLLPVEEIKIALPPSGNASAVLLSSSQGSQTLSKQLLPVPEVRMGEEISEYHIEVDKELYRQPSKPLLEMLEPSTFRDVPYVSLQIRPFSYDGQFSLQITQQALIRIDIQGDTSFRGMPLNDDLAEAFVQTMVNPKQAVQFRNPTKQQIHYADFSKSDYWLRLETDREGLFKITPQHLAGFPLEDIDPRSFRLFSNGGQMLTHEIVHPGNEFVEVPIRVVGAEDGSFDPQDYIVFYGTNRDGVGKNTSLQYAATYNNPYGGNTIWWLTVAGEFSGEPLRMETLPIQQSWNAQTDRFSDQFRLEKENHRRETIGFDWYMTRLFGNSDAEYEFQLQIPDPVPGSTGALRFSMRQEDVSSPTPTQHKIKVFLNDEPILANSAGSDIFSWSGLGTYSFYKEVPNLINGQNTLRIKVLRSGTDNIFLDWITLDYSRRIQKAESQVPVKQMELNLNIPVRYNVSGNANTRIYRVNGFSDVTMLPLQTSGSQSYFVGSGTSNTRFWLCADADLHEPLNVTFKNPTDLGANLTSRDNIIITPDEFVSQAQVLADMYWVDYGLRSQVVKQSDIFDQFNGGHPDPVALRQFLRFAYYNYPFPRLSSVTLLGLGTMDWRNFSGQAQSKNKIITYQRNLIASDDYFVMLTQAAYPELAVGRYPVTNENELAVMLSNFENYTRNPQGGWWRNSTIILGDDLYNGSSNAYESIHTQQAQHAGTVIHPSMLTDKIFAWEYPYDQFQNKPEARDDMFKAINDGRLLWYYLGHGSYDKLGSEDYFNGAADMGRFNNPNKLPFFMAASCSVSHFDYWGFESLGQKTVLMNNLGAIASYSATRLSGPTSNAAMMKNVLKNITHERYPLGKSIMLAKIAYTENNDNDAVYVLMGDPHLRVIPPIPSEQMNVSGQHNSPFENALRHRDLVSIEGEFSESHANGIAEVKVFNTETEYDLDWQTHVSHRGAQLFAGKVSLEGGSFQSSFIVPDDATPGNTGFVVSYYWDTVEKQDYTNYRLPIAFDDETVNEENPDAPKIEMYLGSYDYRDGDTVAPNTTLYAKIEDSNGINLSGISGHGILLVLDNALQPIVVTDYFSYNLDSHTAGQLVFPLSGLSEGPHTLQMIAFDNFNLPAVASVNFNVKKVGELSIERFLIYPNPMDSATNFTFLLSQDCELDIDIFTITGKKAHTIKAFGKQGFNSVAWDGKDGSGHRLANNTYFVKIRAKTQDLKAEAIERLVIFK